MGAIDGILKKEVYCGVWYYGKADKTGKKNSRENWIAVEAPAIIARELWGKAQERRARNRELAKRNAKNDYLVGRRVTCGQCGYKMVGRGTRGVRLYYYCPKAQGDLAEQGCDARYFRAEKVDKAVWSWVRKLLLNPEALREDLKGQQAKREQENQPLRDRLSVVDDLLADNRRQLERLLDLYLSGDFSKEALTERKTRLEGTIAALKIERINLQATMEAQTLSDDQIMTIEDFAKKIAKGLETAEGDFEARRRIIDLLDVQVTLVREEEQEIAYVHCLVVEADVPIEFTTPGS